jgi:hypothetical protein
MSKFSSHIQLQYLLNKYKINTVQLNRELEEYYNNPVWNKVTTKHGKVTTVSLKEGMEAPRKRSLPKPLKPGHKPRPPKTYKRPDPLQTSVPTVIIKKRRTY